MKQKQSKTLDLDYQLPQVIIAPIRGKAAQEIYETVPENLRVNTQYDSEKRSVIGSTNLLAVGIDNVVKPKGFRVLNLADLSLPEIMNFAQDRHYIDARNLVIRSQNDTYEVRNNPLLQTIFELVEEKEGSVKLPFMIEGFSYIKDSVEDTTNLSYGVKIVTGDDFKVVSDERLNGNHNGKKFSKTDELGLPIFDKKGKRIWHASDKGLSRVYLYGDLGLYSNCRFLAFSYDFGRVVIRGAEGADTQKIIEEKLKSLEDLRNIEVAEIEEAYKNARGMLSNRR